MFYPALTALVVTTVWLALRVRSLVRNIHQARSSGLPYTLSLVTEIETWAYLADPIIRKVYRKHLLARQQGWPRWARFMVKDWMYEDKYRAHAELGDVFLAVSPGSVVCYIADPDLAQEVCMRRRDFIKPREKMKMIEPFGPNVVSSEGDLWRFHYRITAPPFGDAANYLVWDETRRQTALLKSAWVRTGVQSLKSDVYAVGVNVMASAGFGRQQDWQSDEAPPSGHQLSLLNAVYGIVTYLPLLLLLPKWLLRNTCKPAWTAFVEFEKYMREYIAEEQSVVHEHTVNKKKGKLSGNLLTALLETNASEQSSRENKSGQRVALNEEEVIGNMFMFFMVCKMMRAISVPPPDADSKAGRVRHDRQHDHLLMRCARALRKRTTGAARRIRRRHTVQPVSRTHRALVYRRLPSPPLHARIYGKSLCAECFRKPANT